MIHAWQLLRRPSMPDHKVEFLKGTIEAIPLPANMTDVAISNCVINLSVDKPAASAETFRT